MATRFGASSPAKAYQAKMRWLVAGLFTIIVILVGLLYWFATSGSSSGDGESQQEVAVSSTDNSSPTVDILVASRRVEQGELVSESMLSMQPVPVDQVPDGTFRSHEKTLLVNKYTATILNANEPFLKAAVSVSQPLETIPIPPGYRAVTINVDRRSGVEGWAKPNSRVDVLWTYQQDGEKKVATIVRFAKVLSVGGQTAASGNSADQGAANTATLLVTEKEAKKVELARSLGTISLSLVGQQEEIGSDDGTEIVDINSILGIKSDVVPKAEEPADGVMYSTDNKTGRKVRYLLRRGRWVIDPDY